MPTVPVKQPQSWAALGPSPFNSDPARLARVVHLQVACVVDVVAAHVQEQQELVAVPPIQQRL